jgi:hypothetical protein
VRRETAGAYLKAAGIGVRTPGASGRRPPAKPANEVTTGSDATKPANTVNPSPNPENLSTKEPAKAGRGYKLKGASVQGELALDEIPALPAPAASN